MLFTPCPWRQAAAAICNAVLDQGALPLATLERVIDERIAAQMKA